MRRAVRETCGSIAGLAVLILLAPSASAAGDVDGDGYIGRVDVAAFAGCMGGPSVTPAPACLEAFDDDDDGDIDLVDYAALSAALGHLPIPLRDVAGELLTVASTRPYSTRATCGECHESHDPSTVANGEWFQQGRADVAGNVDMQDDYYGDGRWWTRSAGRYGKWGQSFQFILAAKHNTHPSAIDQTTFMWVKECSNCHAGGGPGEFDRDGQRLYDARTGRFGYEELGLGAEDVALDGDYSRIDRATGGTSLAPWDRTGVSEPDCLLCHRDKRPSIGGVDQVWGWRRTLLAAADAAVDGAGNPVAAYAAASTAGQGWFSQLSATAAADAGLEAATSADRAFLEAGVAPPNAASVAIERRTGAGAAAPAATTFQIDYSRGVDDGSLLLGADGTVSLAPSSFAYPPRDSACVSCHPFATVTGTVWFDARDVHYRKFTRRNDDDPVNDVPPERSTVCVECHPGRVDHNAAKGNSFQLRYRDELDYEGFRACRDCHLSTSPVRHPDAPEVPGTVIVHVQGRMMEVLSCQACHIPYALVPGVLFRDITIPGSVGTTSQYLSSSPLRPWGGGAVQWYPALRWKVDSDGVERLFPASVWINVYFGDWDRNGTPLDLSDDVISPIYTWRVASVVGPSPLPGTTDDDGDGRIEIDRPEELLAYFAVLRGNDPTGAQVAANPVLVRGHRVWYADPGSPTGISAFEHEGTGIPVTSYPYIWGMDHNVLPKEEAWGSFVDSPAEGCPDCHRPATHDSPVFDRRVLIDPYDPDEGPLYETVRERTGVNPP